MLRVNQNLQELEGLLRVLDVLERMEFELGGARVGADEGLPQVRLEGGRAGEMLDVAV